MGKEASRNGQKNELLTEVQSILSERLNSDVLRVGPSEIALPGVDADGNEFFYLVKVSIPRGTRTVRAAMTLMTVTPKRTPIKPNRKKKPVNVPQAPQRKQTAKHRKPANVKPDR